MNESAVMPHEFTLENRTRLSLSGVSEVNCFNEEMIVLHTSAGVLTVAGEGLFIARLNLEEGKTKIEGKVNSLAYEDRTQKTGLLRRLFR